MKQILKSLFLTLLFYQNIQFFDQNNFEKSLKNIGMASHKFDRQLRHLKKIKFFVEKYAINGQLKSALLSRIKELEQKLSWFNDFSSAIPFLKPFEDKAKIKFDFKTDFIKHLSASIDEEIRSIELVASNLLKISLDGLCPNLNLNTQTIDLDDKKPKKELREGFLLDDGTDSIGEGLAETIGQVAGGPVYGPVVGKVAKVTTKKVTKVLTSPSCWATRAECKKHWVYLSLDIMPTTNNFRTESAYWYNLLYKIEQLNFKEKTFEKTKLIQNQQDLLQEQFELKEKLNLSAKIKLLEKQIEASKIPVNTQVEEQLIAVLKRLIDFRLNQIHFLNNRKRVGLDAIDKIKALETEISQLKSALAAKQTNP